MFLWNVEVLVEGLRFARKVARSESLKRIGLTLSRDALAGCEHLNFDGDDYLRCLVRNTAENEGHGTGTCKMGPAGDRGAVVDPQLLKVRGIHGLRIVDASIMPRAVSGNTNGPTIMIGEKGSDMIKNYWL